MVNKRQRFNSNKNFEIGISKFEELIFTIITQIEQALLKSNGDVFANLYRQYILHRYYTAFSSGLVKGKSKKGTPYSFIPYIDYFIFNEIITHKKS